MESGHKTFRIPGSREYILIPAKNTLRLSDITMSAYIYMEKEYAVIDERGVKREMMGKELMERFGDRSKREKKSAIKRK